MPNSIKLIETDKYIEMNSQIIIDTINRNFWIDAGFSFVIALTISISIYYLLKHKRKIEFEFFNYREKEHNKWHEYLKKQKHLLDSIAFENYEMNSDNMDLICKQIGIDYQKSDLGKKVSDNYSTAKEKINQFYNELNRDNNQVS